MTKSSQVSVASVDQRCKLFLSINTELNHCIRRALTIPVGGVENTKSSQNIFWWIKRYYTRSNECQYISWISITWPGQRSSVRWLQAENLDNFLYEGFPLSQFSHKYNTISKGRNVQCSLSILTSTFHLSSFALHYSLPSKAVNIFYTFHSHFLCSQHIHYHFTLSLSMVLATFCPILFKWKPNRSISLSLPRQYDAEKKREENRRKYFFAVATG